MSRFVESIVEDASLAWFEALGYQVRHGPQLAAGERYAERVDHAFRDVVLRGRLEQAVALLNPGLPSEALADALKKLTLPPGACMMERNRAVHRMLVDGVTVEYRRPDGSIAGAQARVVNFEKPDDNDWLVVNQFTVAEGDHVRRPDVLVFLNGLPIAVIELKNAVDQQATIGTAIQQLATYQLQIPSLFTYNLALVASDGVVSRIGAIGAGKEWFKPWRTVTGEQEAPAASSELQIVIEGVFEKRRLLDLLRFLVAFEDEGGGRIAKKLAGYHQFHAVNAAVEETLRAAKGKATGKGGSAGDHRVGVVWHTQGSGKSLTMAFYAGRLVLHSAMENPTVVVLTDRNDLDDQLFGTFSRCQDVLRQPPVQVQDRQDLQNKLQVGGGGIVFTTIQKFLPIAGEKYPKLSDRSNIVVMADEAHRSQYDFIDGFASHMRAALPNASFIGFTGTPVEATDRNTRAVFGDYISVYDIQRAVEDGATVRIYYENRLAKLKLKEGQQPKIDPDFEEVTEGEEVERKEQLKTRWAQMAAIVGAEARLKLVAADLVQHFEQRTSVMEGKAMVVCMSRRICVDLYNAIQAIRPQWCSPSDDAGRLKIIMTGNATDPTPWQDHIRNKARREAMAKRFRTASDPFQIVIVRDMWLTGFDAPSLHTMYLDKPMHGHALMQAIARVNRVFKDKPGGLVVDYLGIADELRQALITYTEAGGAGEAALDQGQAVEAMLEKYDICRGLFHGFDWSDWTSGTPQDRVGVLPAAQEHILAQRDGKKRLLDSVTALSKAFALAVPHEDALAIKDDVAFFQAVRAVLNKKAAGEQRSDEELDHAIRQIVSNAIASDEVVDIFAAAGLKKPDISILSDEFLAEVRGMPRKNVAVELLRKLLMGEIRARSRRNVVQARSFRDLLERSLQRYQNRAVEAAQVIEELIQVAREVRQASARGEELGLTEAELAFYDALEANDSAVKVLGEPTLKEIARELVKSVRSNIAIDWTVRDNVRAKLRVMVKRILREHGYPPDKQEKATQTVLEQAEVMTEAWLLGRPGDGDAVELALRDSP